MVVVIIGAAGMPNDDAMCGDTVLSQDLLLRIAHGALIRMRRNRRAGCNRSLCCGEQNVIFVFSDFVRTARNLNDAGLDSRIAYPFG